MEKKMFKRGSGAKKFKNTVQIPENDVQMQQRVATPQPPQMDPKVAQWVSRNQWFVDPTKKSMRKYAEGVHEELQEKYGVEEVNLFGLHCFVTIYTTLLDFSL